MKKSQQFKIKLVLTILLSQAIPLMVGGVAFVLLNKYAELDHTVVMELTAVAVAACAVLVAGIIYRYLGKPLGLVSKHLHEMSHNNLAYRTQVKHEGLFGLFFYSLNRFSDLIQELRHQTTAEAAILTSESNRLRNILNSINDGVVALDRDNHIVIFNKAATIISGYGFEEVAGKPLHHVMPILRGNQLTLSDWLAKNRQQALAKQHWDGLKLKTKDGKDRSINVDVLYQATDPNGIRTVITFHDRTEAQEIEDMKVDFVALAAHELRTPITVIKGYLEILESEVNTKLTPEELEFIRKLELSATQLSSIINNILRVSRIEHGNLNLKIESVDWPVEVKGVIKELANKASVQHKKIELAVDPQLELVAADRMSINEVLINLIDNAIKYSNPASTIRVAVRPINNMVETTVQDEGVGLSSHDIDQLFTKFYRSHRTRNSHIGTGLGLYMSKGIIEAHGGEIWVQSKEGVGSTFGFTLPLYKNVDKAQQTEDNNNKIIRGVHGWIKNHSFYRG
jgi:PAS domain S-box-containing protein